MNGLRCVCHGRTYTTVSSYLEAHGGEQLELELDTAAPAPSRIYVGTFEDGSQVLLEVHAPEAMTAATRPSRRSVWGPPAMLDEAP